MHYDFAVVVPKGTTEASPVEQTLKLTAGLIVFPSIEFPAGCRGYVSLKLMHGGHKLYPLDPSGVYNTEDFTIPISDFYPLFSAPYELKAVAWAPQTDYDHTITVRLNLIRIEDLEKLFPFLAGLSRLMQLMGVSPAPVSAAAAPPEEEVVAPPAPPTPPVEEVVPPTAPPAPPAVEEIIPPPAPAPPPAPPAFGGKILEVSWRLWGSEVWHPMSDPIPYNERGTDYALGFKVKNTKVAATFKVGMYSYDAFLKWHWSYSPPRTLATQAEELLEWPLSTWGVKGSEAHTCTLFADDTKVDETEVVIKVE